MSELNAVGDQNNTSQVQMEPCEKPENVNTTQEIKELNSNVEISKEENKISEVTQNLNEICTNCVPELSVEQKNVSESQPEVKSENTEVKTEIKDENEVQNIAPVIKEKENPVENTSEIPKVAGDFERVQNENKNLTVKIQNLERDLQVRTEERENFKNKAHVLETEINELKNAQPNTLSPSQQNAVEKMKKQSEEILTRAKGVIFDKTKLIKHQELQIETLSLQVTSLKEVLAITKELLEIRNLEVKELQEKMNFMEQKIAGEKLRHDLMNAKMDTMVKMNTDLKTEYETQLQLFTELRTAYAEKDEFEKQGKST